MSDESTEQTEDNYEDFAVGTLFGRTYLEKLLLSIIEAYPFGQDTPETRLKVAVHALTGENSKAETVKQDNDLPALKFMAVERERDKVKRFDLLWKGRKRELRPDLPEVRSDLALAKEAADKFFDPPNEQARKSTYDRLREKFSGVYYRKRGKGLGINFGEHYKYLAVEHDDIAETLEAQSLDIIRDELRENGVKTAR